MTSSLGPFDGQECIGDHPCTTMLYIRRCLCICIFVLRALIASAHQYCQQAAWACPCKASLQYLLDAVHAGMHAVTPSMTGLLSS